MMRVKRNQKPVLQKDKFEFNWRFQVGAPTSNIVTANGIIYFSANFHVYAVDMATGKEKWKFKIENGLPDSLTHSDGTIFVGTQLNVSVYSLDAKTGEKNGIAMVMENFLYLPQLLLTERFTIAMKIIHMFLIQKVNLFGEELLAARCGARPTNSTINHRHSGIPPAAGHLTVSF